MLKLAKLPDRTKIKMMFAASTKLNGDIEAYAALYRNTYGEAASGAELIPFMLESFLKSDPAFVKARREGLPESEPAKTARARVVRAGKPALASPNAHPATSQPKEE